MVCIGTDIIIRCNWCGKEQAIEFRVPQGWTYEGWFSREKTEPGRPIVVPKGYAFCCDVCRPKVYLRG